MATSLRVSDSTRAHAAALASQTGETLGAVVEHALTEYERTLFWEQTATALSAMSIESDAGRNEWDVTTRDGLDHD